MAVEDKVEEEGNEVNVVLVCNDFGLRGRGGEAVQQHGRGTRW